MTESNIFVVTHFLTCVFFSHVCGLSPQIVSTWRAEPRLVMNQVGRSRSPATSSQTRWWFRMNTSSFRCELRSSQYQIAPVSMTHSCECSSIYSPLESTIWYVPYLTKIHKVFIYGLDTLVHNIVVADSAIYYC